MSRLVFRWICCSLIFFYLAFVRALGQHDASWMIEVCQVSSEAAVQQASRISLEEASKDWQQNRMKIVNEWRKFLGPMPVSFAPPEWEVLETTVIGNVSRQRIRYESEPGCSVEAYLLAPHPLAADQKYPAIVALHPTTKETIEEIAGVHTNDARATGLQLASHGYFVICPKNFLWGNGKTFDEAVTMHRQRHPATLGMAKMLHDAVRAVDILASHPAVDATRIGAFGHSLGAKETLYLAAFDERISVAVASEGGLALDSTNWDAPWYLGPAIQAPDFGLNHHQLLGLIAPRPFLILGGETGPGAADGNRSLPLVEAARPAWLSFGPRPRLGLLNHGQGHVFGTDQLAKTTQWFDSVLMKSVD